jgi:hypothetical protein
MIRRLLGRALLCVSLIVLGTPGAARATVAPPTTPVTGNATYFDGLGQPYGGCGMPQANLDSQDFVALNVFDTPGDYGAYPRPVPAAQADKMGVWNNGLNCGRWVQVKVGDYCTGTNDGAQNQPFCRNGSWAGDAYNGATLTMLVADSCADSNAWCRDDPYHLDLAKNSLNRFQLNGTAVGDMYPNHWNNRHISWNFVSAPNYSGDLQIGFLQGAQSWWGAIAISHLPNGIHGVEYYSGGAWQSAAMDGDMGQAYIVSPTTSGGTQFQIRVKDASDALVNGGEVYNFGLPSSCSAQCSAPYTQVSYTTGTSTPSPSPSPTTTSPSPTTSPAQGCSVTQSIVNSWSGGYQLQFTVTNNSAKPTTGWQMPFSFSGGQTVASSWSAVVSQSGGQYTAANASWNGVIPAGGSTTWGAVVNGTPAQATVPGCTAPV